MAVKKSVLTPVMTLEGHEPYTLTSPDGVHHEIKYVECISYFPDGKQMISGSEDKTIRRWDLREGKEIKEAREVCEEGISAVGISRDGRWVVTAVGGVLEVSEVETGIVRTFLDGFSWIDCIDISADSTLVAVGSIDSQVRIWSLDTGKLVAGSFKISYGGDRDYLGALRFSEDSKKLAVISYWGKWLQVWDVQAQKLDVTTKKFLTPDNFPLIRTPPIFWITKDKSIIAAPSFTLDSGIREPTTIYEFDASTLQTIGDSFEGHTGGITGLALSSDCILLASASRDSTINLWSFESRQLLASFQVDVQIHRSLIFSPDSCQLAYTTLNELNIYVCDIPVNILASIGLAKQKSGPESPHLSKLLNSDATRHAVRRKPAISVVSPAPRPLMATIDPPQPIFLGFLRKFLPSRTGSPHPIRTNEPRDPLDFSATAPLPRPLVNPHENPPTTQSSAPASASFKSRLHHLSTWWPLQTGHTSPAIVPVPHAQGKERNAAADAPRRDDEWIPSENYVSPPPSPNPDSRQPATAGQTSTGEHGSGRSCFCF
jgi:WD40 repeat protein